MKTVCKENQCAGCMACADICPKQCIEIKDDLEYMNAVIDPEICIHCNACHRVCQVNHPANLQAPIKWFQGWAEKDIRGKSSSGGFSSAIEQSFIQNGGVVAACKLIDGDYRFVLANYVDDLIGVAGSKYVKSNPVGIYRKVKQELINGKKVLFLGLPCQVSAMRNFIGEKYSDSLYTIDLICHGTPSIKILRKALKEYHVDIYKQKEILFRKNDRFFLESDLKRITPVGIEDFYTTAFMRGIDYTENCYACYYATGERVSDLTLGDSWGSEIHEEEHNGISLALVQTSKGEELLNMTGVELHEVDLDKAKVPNTQLRHPTIKGNDHDTFFRHLMKGQSFKRSVIAVWPKQCIKQEIKIALIKLGIYHRGGGRTNVRNCSKMILL